MNEQESSRIELWKAIEGFPGYEVSSHGNVRSFKKRSGFGKWKISQQAQRYLKQVFKSNGYKCIHISNGDKLFFLTVHRLVVAAFLGPCPENMEVCHINNDKADNHIENLKYDSHANNQADAARAGLYGKLTPAQVIDLRQRYAAGEKVESLAAQFDISLGTVYVTAGKGNNYKYVSEPRTISRGVLSRRKLSSIQVQDIRDRKEKGEKQRRIAEFYGVSESLISKIVHKKRRLT